jgi:hypothetical protein
MKTQQITISEVRLVYRTKVKASERLQVKCSKDAFDIFMENWDLDSIVSVCAYLILVYTELNIVMFNFYENCASPVPAAENKKALILLYTNALIIVFCSPTRNRT